jgi:hypothetical protein
MNFPPARYSISLPENPLKTPKTTGYRESGRPLQTHRLRQCAGWVARSGETHQGMNSD